MWLFALFQSIQPALALAPQPGQFSPGAAPAQAGSYAAGIGAGAFAAAIPGGMAFVAASVQGSAAPTDALLIQGTGVMSTQRTDDAVELGILGARWLAYDRNAVRVAPYGIAMGIVSAAGSTGIGAAGLAIDAGWRRVRFDANLPLIGADSRRPKARGTGFRRLCCSSPRPVCRCASETTGGFVRAWRARCPPSAISTSTAAGSSKAPSARTSSSTRSAWQRVCGSEGRRRDGAALGRHSSNHRARRVRPAHRPQEESGVLGVGRRKRRWIAPYQAPSSTPCRPNLGPRWHAKRESLSTCCSSHWG